MDYSAITANVNVAAVTTGVVMIFAAFAGVLIVIVGGRLLLDAINDDGYEEYLDRWGAEDDDDDRTEDD